MGNVDILVDRVPETPVELGFDPAQLPTWRPYQRQTVQKIHDAAADAVLIVNAPTGSGKSALALASARMRYGSTTVLTHQKALQLQYMEHRLKEPLRLATGRDNHPCVLEDQPVGLTAAHAPCVTEDFACAYMRATNPMDIVCPYFKQKGLAEIAPIRILNYPYYFLQAKQGKFRSGLLVCDEGHRLDKALLQAESVRFSQLQLDNLRDADLSLPKTLKDGAFLTDVPAMVAWVFKAKGHAMTQRASIYNSTAVREKWRILWLALDQLESLIHLHATVMWREQTRTWVPILSSEIASNILTPPEDAPIQKLVVMSATVFDPAYIAARLGRPRHQATYIEVPSNFPVDRRLIYVRPVERMNVTTSRDPLTLRTMADTIDNIVEQFDGRKGMIHCGSFALGKELAVRSRYRERMILAVPGDPRVDEFRSSQEGIYVSPSAYEGYDFKDGLCRFNIVAKISWPNRGDPVVAAQLNRIPGFNEYEAASALIQAAGRGMRHAGDWCTTFVLDGTVFQLFAALRRQGVELPKWFMEAVRY